jgi:MFS family permease
MAESRLDDKTGKLPRMTAVLLPRELTSWSLSAVPMGVLEGGLLGVIVKNQFAHVASPLVVNFAVAVVAGAPAFANLSSFLFSSFAVGRDKLVILSYLMLGIAACLLIMALPGRSLPGLVMFSVMTILARSAWSGILTIRAAVWRANYPRRWRGRVTARIVQLAAFLIAGVSALTGWLMDWSEDAYRTVFPLAAISMVVASLVYRRGRVRRHGQLRKAEQAAHSARGGRLSLLKLRELLRKDREFSLYMLGMMILGSGNMMIIAMLVIVINDHFSLSRVHQVIITSSIPLLILCVSIPVWARVLDSRHIFAFRAVHSWFFAATAAIFAAAAISKTAWLLWLGSVLLGAAYAGGHLGWNLGHNDFSDDANSTQYMAIHVTLTGIRGLIMPVAGVGFYQFLGSISPDLGPWSMLLPCLLTLLGSVYFLQMQRARARASR